MLSQELMREIAIIGGGPAGAVCGEHLARAGYSVTIFDEHLAWEKPCGGGLTQRALTAFPYLLTSDAPKKRIHEVELIADGNRARFSLELPIVIYAPKVLNGLLLDRAKDAGCKIVHARVTRLDTSSKRPRMEAEGTVRDFDFAVIAAGARNALLPASGPLAASSAPPLAKEDLELTLGYYIPAESVLMKIKFVKGLHGYAWSFPRQGHLSVGVCASMALHTARDLREVLGAFVSEEKLDIARATLFSHVLPSPLEQTLRDRPAAGENWALVGDAAAWVDPVTGEGIYYAMRSGEILGSVLAQEGLEAGAAAYPSRIRAAFRGELEQAARLSHMFYHGNFLGGAVTTRMISFARHSKTFRRTLADVFAGTQNYRTLKMRLWSQLGITLVESAGSFLRGGKPADSWKEKRA